MVVHYNRQRFATERNTKPFVPRDSNIPLALKLRVLLRGYNAQRKDALKDPYRQPELGAATDPAIVL
jgi:hypothetical protein